MRELKQWQNILFLVGGALMVVGAGCFSVVLWNAGIQRVACWVFLVGAVLFTVMQVMQVYDGRSFVVRRLKRIQGIADLLFLVSGFLMVDRVYALLRPFFVTDVDYLNTIGNKWVLALLIAAILEMYTATRISSELKKEREYDE